MTESDLDQIEARAKAALVCYMGCDASDPARCLGVRPDELRHELKGCRCPCHATFYGTYRALPGPVFTDDIPALIAEVRRLRALFERHGHHEPSCPWPKRCVCGWAEIAAALLDAAPPAAGDVGSGAE